VHPDRVHSATGTEKQAANQSHAELNEAYQCLLEPKERLPHLLELERGTKSEEVRKISAGMMNLFMESFNFDCPTLSKSEAVLPNFETADSRHTGVVFWDRMLEHIDCT